MCTGSINRVLCSDQSLYMSKQDSVVCMLLCLLWSLLMQGSTHHLGYMNEQFLCEIPIYSVIGLLHKISLWLRLCKKKYSSQSILVLCLLSTMQKYILGTFLIILRKMKKQQKYINMLLRLSILFISLASSTVAKYISADLIYQTK